MQYCRLGFNCESIMNVNCNFSPKAQLLECNYYYAMIDSAHTTHMLMLFCSCNQKSASYPTWSLLPVTTFQLLTKQDRRPASPSRWTSRSREQLPVIAMCWTMARKANTIGKDAAENDNAATIKRFKASHDIEESTPLVTIQEALTTPYKNHVVVWSNVACTKRNY